MEEKQDKFRKGKEKYVRFKPSEKEKYIRNLKPFNLGELFIAGIGTALMITNSGGIFYPLETVKSQEVSEKV